MPRVTSVVTPIAHLVGPGKIKVVNGNLAYAIGRGHLPLRLDPHSLRAIYCYGPVGVTDDAMRVLFHHGIETVWLTSTGTRCRGRLIRSNPSGASLRLLQHRILADPERVREAAVRMVVQKIESQRRAARHYQRQGIRAAGPILHSLAASAERCPLAQLDELRGIEGAATASWFELFGQLLHAPWTFTRRARRPPPDPINALLSLGYTWLLARTVARCESVGLEVYLGALHAFRAGRPSLACDLMEPLRVPAVDRWVVEACNQNRLGPGDFEAGDWGISLRRDRFSAILADWEEHWQSCGHEEALDCQMAEFVNWLRGQAPAAPDATPDNEADDL